MGSKLQMARRQGTESPANNCVFAYGSNFVRISANFVLNIFTLLSHTHCLHRQCVQYFLVLCDYYDVLMSNAKYKKNIHVFVTRTNVFASP